MLKTYEVCCDLFHGFDWSSLEDRHRRCSDSALLPKAQEHISSRRTARSVSSRRYRTCRRHLLSRCRATRRSRYRKTSGFSRRSESVLTKSDDPDRQVAEYELDHAIRQIVSVRLSSDEVIESSRRRA